MDFLNIILPANFRAVPHMRKKTRHSLIRTPHTHPPDPGEHRRAHGLWGHLASALHLPGHTHAHAVPGHRGPMLTNRRGTLALRWSLTRNAAFMSTLLIPITMSQYVCLRL